MIRHCSLLVVLAALLTMAGSALAATTSPATTPLEGALHGGRFSIGGETTGWTLGTSSGAVEVDVSRIQKAADTLDGKHVIVTGGWAMRDGPENGARRVFVADTIAAAPAAPIAPTTQVAPAIVNSGVRGVITRKTGDWMPPVDHKRARIEPLSALVQIFQHGKQVATVISNHEGRFSMALPPGTYTIIAHVGGNGDDSGMIQVKKDAWLECDFCDSSKAVW